MTLFAILKLKAIQKKKNKCKGRIKTVNLESYISFLLLATRKCNLHIVQTIKWYKVKKKNNSNW